MFQALERLAGGAVDGIDAAGLEEELFETVVSDAAEAAALAGAADSSGDVEIESAERGLTAVDARFAGQIATSVWLGYMTDAAAREALLSYAIACQLCQRGQLIGLRDALLAEYRCCRERQDLVS